MKTNPCSFKILNSYTNGFTSGEGEYSPQEATNAQSLTSPEAKARIKQRKKQIEKVKEIQLSIKKLQRLLK